MKALKKQTLIILLVTVLLSYPVYSQSNETNLEDGQITLNFQDASISEILDYLSETAGLIIMSDTYIEGRINLVSKQPINIDEAVALINTILKEKGYAAIRTERTLKLVKIEEAKHLNIPVTSGSDPDKIETGDDLVTHIIPIRYANAVKLKEDISSLVPNYAVLSSNEASNSLIITDTKANIRRLIQIVQALDTQMASNADVKVFHLMYADAENTATLINEVFDQDKNQSSSSSSSNPFAGMRRFGGPPMPGAESSTQDSAGATNIKIVAAADEQTNTVVVSGPSDTLEVISKVVSELDSNPDEERTIFVYPLKNAQAENLKEVLNNLFEEMQQLSQQGSSGNGSGQINRGFAPPGMTQTGSGTSSSTDLSEQVYVENDDTTNSLLVMTSFKNYEKIKKVIDELDKPVPQVLIKVLLAEVTTSNCLDIGTEFSILNMRSGGGQSLFQTDFLPDNPTGGFITKIAEGDLDFTLRALEEIGKLNVLSRPYILTSNNETAKITVGKEVPFITDTRTTETGQTINTIQYEDIGIILEVTPSINLDGLVSMTIKPEISTTTAETVPISETVDAAVFAKRSSESRVAVKNNQTIVIGGLMQDQETDTIKKVPLVGDIPLLGGLFKRTIKEKEKTELLIFLTPQVASESANLFDISEHEKSKSKMLNNLNENPALKEHIENLESPAKPH